MDSFTRRIKQTRASRAPILAALLFCLLFHHYRLHCCPQTRIFDRALLFSTEALLICVFINRLDLSIKEVVCQSIFSAQAVS